MRHGSLCTHEFLAEHTLTPWEPQGEGERLILKKISHKASNLEDPSEARPDQGGIAIETIVFSIITILLTTTELSTDLSSPAVATSGDLEPP